MAWKSDSWLGKLSFSINLAFWLKIHDLSLAERVVFEMWGFVERLGCKGLIFFLVGGQLLKYFVFYFYAPNGVFYALIFGDFFGFFAEILQIFWFLMTFYGFLRSVLAATYKKTDLLGGSL